MKIEDIVENKDGSATMTLDLEPEEVSLLIEGAIVQALKDYVEKHDRENAERAARKGDLPGNSFEI